MLLEFAGNIVVWAIVALALFCYVVEFDLILSRDPQWKRQASTWLGVLPILLSALPLLGLLGTITGLLTVLVLAATVTFRSVAVVSRTTSPLPTVVARFPLIVVSAIVAEGVKPMPTPPLASVSASPLPAIVDRRMVVGPNDSTPAPSLFGAFPSKPFPSTFESRSTRPSSA